MLTRAHPTVVVLAHLGVFLPAKTDVALGTEHGPFPQPENRMQNVYYDKEFINNICTEGLLVTRAAHRVGKYLVAVDSRLEFKGPFGLLRSFRNGHASARFLAPAAGTLGAHGAVPTSRGDLVKAHAVDVVATVAKVAEQHFVFVGMVVTLGATLALCAFPCI